MNAGPNLTEREVYAALADIFADVFPGFDAALTPQLSARDIPGWDSFRQIEIVMAAEERFGVRFRTKEIDALSCVGDLAALVRQKRG